MAFLGLAFLIMLFSVLVDYLSADDSPPFGPFKHGYLGGDYFLAIERVSFSARSRFLFFALIAWVLFGSLYFMIVAFKKMTPLLSKLFLLSFLASILLAATTALFSPRRKSGFDFENKKVNFIYSRYLFFPVTQSIDFDDVESVSQQLTKYDKLWICQIKLKPKKGTQLLLGYCMVEDSTSRQGADLVQLLNERIFR